MPRASTPIARACRRRALIGTPSALQDERADSTERVDANESAEAIDPAEPTESIEQADPTEPTESTEPTDPIERIESSLAIERIEPVDHSDVMMAKLNCRVCSPPPDVSLGPTGRAGRLRRRL